MGGVLLGTSHVLHTEKQSPSPEAGDCAQDGAGKVPVLAPHPLDRQGCGSSVAERQAGEGFCSKQSSGEVWLKSAEIMETLGDTSVNAAESKQHSQSVLGPNHNLAMPVP